MYPINSKSNLFSISLSSLASPKSLFYGDEDGFRMLYMTQEYLHA
jgi:hypothetical protein